MSDDDIANIPAVHDIQVSNAAGGGKKQPQWLRIASIGIVLLGVAAIIQAVDDWVDSRASQRQEVTLNDRIGILNNQFTCRYVLGQEATELQSQMTLELALGLAAYASGDEAGLQRHTQTIESLSPLLEAAIEERGQAAEVCDQPRE